MLVLGRHRGRRSVSNFCRRICDVWFTFTSQPPAWIISYCHWAIICRGTTMNPTIILRLVSWLGCRKSFKGIIVCGPPSVSHNTSTGYNHELAYQQTWVAFFFFNFPSLTYWCSGPLNTPYGVPPPYVDPYQRRPRFLRKWYCLTIEFFHYSLEGWLVVIDRAWLATSRFLPLD